MPEFYDGNSRPIREGFLYTQGSIDNLAFFVRDDDGNWIAHESQGGLNPRQYKLVEGMNTDNWRVLQAEDDPLHLAKCFTNLAKFTIEAQQAFSKAKRLEEVAQTP